MKNLYRIVKLIVPIKEQQRKCLFKYLHPDNKAPCEKLSRDGTCYCEYPIYVDSYEIVRHNPYKDDIPYKN